MTIPSRRQLLRDTVAAASLIGIHTMLDTLFQPASATVPAGQNAHGARLPFAHPGILHSHDDLKAIRERIRSGAEPWKTAWEQFKADKILAPDTPKPVAQVYRGPYAKPDIGSTAILHDSGAAYGHALLAALSPDSAESEAHYRQAVAYLDAWSGTLRAIEGHDQKLLCGMTGYKFAAAAELVLYAGNAPRGLWSAERAQALKDMLTGIFLPPIRELFPEANGNWDAAMITTILSIAVLCDDHPLFDHAVDLYLNSGGNGAITNYIWPSGQIEETTRDQGHVQMGIGFLAAACRIARVQGVDLYGAADNRLALGFEYTAKYNMGEDVPSDGGVPGAGARGKLGPIYEDIYQHYAVEKGLPMPYTRRVVEQKRPEGYNSAFPSWGTLTACRMPDLPLPQGDILAAAQAAALPPRNGEREIMVESPSGHLNATIGVRGGRLTYSLRDKRGRYLLRPSTAGIVFGSGIPALDGGLALWEAASSHRQIDRPRFFGEHGEQHAASAPSLPFQQCMLTLREIAAPHRILRAELRVYDAGIAFRLTLPPNRDPGTRAKTATERTAFVFPESATVYASHAGNGEYHPVAVPALKPGVSLPCTVRVAGDGPYLSVLEVDETTGGAPQTLLSPSPTTPGAVVTDARGPIAVLDEASTSFPWRIVLTGETPAQLANSARLTTSLWPRSVLPDADRSWVRPGSAIRATTQTTDGGIAGIDFAARSGLRYLVFDSGWYGTENDAASDARRAGPPNLDIPRVIAYGKEKGIGVFLSIGAHAAEKQLPDLASLYQSWGVAGITLGIGNTGTVRETQWLRNAAALCARHHLLVAIRDACTPVGISGAYPNLLAQGSRNDSERRPSTPSHHCTLPFTRLLCGPVSDAIGDQKTTAAHRLALSLLCYSPFTLLSGQGDPAEQDFLRALPGVWDETVWLGGEIGEWAAVARRSGRDWFIGAITNESPRTVSLPFAFLPDGVSFTVRAYADSPLSAPVVHRGASALKIALPAAGGITLKLTAT